MADQLLTLARIDQETAWSRERVDLGALVREVADAVEPLVQTKPLALVVRAADAVVVDGNPIYPQHELPANSPFMGVAYSGQYEGKLLWVHHTHDASLWPSDGVVYQAQVLRAQGQEAAQDGRGPRDGAEPRAR